MAGTPDLREENETRGFTKALGVEEFFLYLPIYQLINRSCIMMVLRLHARTFMTRFASVSLMGRLFLGRGKKGGLGVGE